MSTVHEYFDRPQYLAIARCVKSFCKVSLILTAFASLGACANLKGMREKADLGERLDPSNVAVEISKDDLAEAAQAPLYDLNLKRLEIPAGLTEFEQLYYLPKPVECESLVAEIAELTYHLGADPGFAELMRAEAGDDITEEKDYSVTLNAGDALEETITGYIPYAHLVRRVSGATKHEKERQEAYMRGQLRRSFLYGTAWHMECDMDPVKLGEKEKDATFVEARAGLAVLPADEFAVLATVTSATGDEIEIEAENAPTNANEEDQPQTLQNDAFLGLK